MKKSYLVLALILILAVISTQYSKENPAASVDTAIAEAALLDSAQDGNDRNNTNDTNDDSDSNNSWGNPRTLQDHFERHGGDFNATDAQDYARQAHEFYLNRDSYQVKTQDGVARVYDSESNTFGAYNADGTTRTFYKPSGGQAYLNRQPGS